MEENKIIILKAAELMKHINQGNYGAFTMAMMRPNGQVDIVCNGSAGDQAINLLCLDNNTRKKMFLEHD